ncbi:nucleotide disphospho-sugar-binding domain-containing protein [Streptomyces sp. NPDC050439]|uniref:nucleotide disphospho-sugar-binding domain-containing protein n=1 Tax=unclassified Streptomyces TaxID=2593676 RepID=UPI003413862A
MRVLLMSTPVPTHFTPMVPLAWALRAAGHEVLVAGQPDVLPAVAAAGLNGVSIGPAYHVEDFLSGAAKDGRRPIESASRADIEKGMTGAGTGWSLHTRYLCEAYLEMARFFGPDLVVCDPLEFSAPIVGTLTGAPVVRHRWGVDPMSDLAHTRARQALGSMCERLGLAELPGPDLVLDPCPPSLQLPATTTGAPIRHVPYNGNGGLPRWLAHHRADPGVRRVAVTLGGHTLDMNGVPLVRRMLQAFGDRPGVEVLATVDARHRDDLGPLPGSVRLVDPVPLNLLLRTCDAVVHHGGAGTAMTATAFGLPQLVLPQFADQFAHGDRIADSGAGIALDDADAQNDPRSLRDSFTELLTEPRYAKAAHELRAEMEGMPSPARVVTDLEQLAKTGRRAQ